MCVHFRYFAIKIRNFLTAKMLIIVFAKSVLCGWELSRNFGREGSLSVRFMKDKENKSIGRILIIEDDKEIADLINLHLGDLNYETVHCGKGKSGLETALNEQFDLVILDIMLPDLDGFEICRRLRAEQSYLPVLILSSRAKEMDRVIGLELGADDYLTKPFSIRELIARVKAIFRRMESLSDLSNNGEENGTVNFGDLEIDMQKRKVLLAGKTVDLTVKEFDLLKLFANNPGRAYSRENLLNIIWGYSFDGYDHTVNSHINRLRMKIENDPAKPRFIKTVWGFGYRFAERTELE